MPSTVNSRLGKNMLSAVYYAEDILVYLIALDIKLCAVITKQAKSAKHMGTNIFIVGYTESSSAY